MSRYLILGGSGFLGSALTHRYIQSGDKVFVLSRNEERQWNLKQKIKSEHLHCIIGDIRDYRRLRNVMASVQPDYIIIAAAMKQIDVCEASPSECIETNILGVQNVLNAIETTTWNPRAVCFISSDKAVSCGINTYGTSKAIGERSMLNRAPLHPETCYVVARYGNVLNSSGSVLPVFEHQAKNGSAFTLTSVDMTRFTLSINEAMKVIDDALFNAKSGEIWIPKVKALSIQALAEYYSAKYNKPIKVVGVRSGEKIHELLMSKEEHYTKRFVNDSHYYVVSKSGCNTGFEYCSKDHVMCYTELSQMMETHDS